MKAFVSVISIMHRLYTSERISASALDKVDEQPGSRLRVCFETLGSNLSASSELVNSTRTLWQSCFLTNFIDIRALIVSGGSASGCQM